MIYLCWKFNFRADRAEINFLPVWVIFPLLPVEYYTEGWLKRAGDSIGRTIKKDIKTLLASTGKFARVWRWISSMWGLLEATI